MPDGTVLRIEPGAAERIARAFETHAENLATVMNSLRNRGHTTGFAGFPSAVELDAGFARKARLAVEHLQKQIATTNDMAAKIRAAAAAYTATDSDSSSALDTSALNPPGSVG